MTQRTTSAGADHLAAEVGEAARLGDGDVAVTGREAHDLEAAPDRAPARPLVVAPQPGPGGPVSKPLCGTVSRVLASDRSISHVSVMPSAHRSTAPRPGSNPPIASRPPV
ncbi:hypothetical protein ACQP1P_25370 [Dactylosporangium sp. CA-052675]|uniref:hypothetical protein n=1 Tax=Dactylosporangium sp. CA-052675 TaxID=3239927 RepID=UPI003D926848